MLTMVLGGLWHGAGWTFVFWGFLYGGALIVEHARVDRRKDRALVVQRQRLELAAAFDGLGEAAPLPDGPGAASARAEPPRVRPPAVARRRVAARRRLRLRDLRLDLLPLRHASPRR